MKMYEQEIQNSLFTCIGAPKCDAGWPKEAKLPVLAPLQEAMPLIGGTGGTPWGM